MKAARGWKLPDWFAKPPKLDPKFRWLLDAYWRLCTERTGNGSIPWSIVRQYAEVEGLRGHLADDFEAIIYGLEDGFRQWQDDNPPSKEPPPGTTGKGKGKTLQRRGGRLMA